MAIAIDVDTTFNDPGSAGAMYYALAQFFPSTATWDKTTVYMYDGTSTKAAFIGEVTASPPRPGLQGSHMPNQVCCVVTLNTDYPGRSHRGRMYIPAGGVQLGADGYIPTSLITALSLHFAEAFSATNSSGEGRVVVMSATASVATPVTKLTVDDRCDIQRRRASSEAIGTRVSQLVTS